MPQQFLQDNSSGGVTRPEMDRAWEAIHKLTETIQAEVIHNRELKTMLLALIEKMDDFVTNGTARCADRQARLLSLEDSIDMIELGTHPSCIAQYRGLKLWTYTAAIGGILALVSIVSAIL